MIDMKEIEPEPDAYIKENFVPPSLARGAVGFLGVIGAVGVPHFTRFDVDTPAQTLTVAITPKLSRTQITSPPNRRCSHLQSL